MFLYLGEKEGKTVGFLSDVYPLKSLLITLIIGGSVAYLIGRASALAWGNNWQIVLYILLLVMAVRFAHFSLFEGKLIAPYYYLLDFVILSTIAFSSKLIVRKRQMNRQYDFFNVTRNPPRY